MERNGVIHLGGYVTRREMSPYSIAIGNPDDVLMVRMHAVGEFGRQRDIETCRRKQFRIPPRIGTTLLVPRRHMRQLHSQHRGLNRIESEVAADLVMVVLRLRAMIPQPSKTRRERAIVSGHQAGVA